MEFERNERDSRQVSIMYLVDGSRSRWVNILSKWTRDKVVSTT